MVRTVVKLAIAALVVHAVWKVSPVYLDYVKFRDELTETARRTGARRENEILERVMEVATSMEIPVTREAVRVRKDRDHTFIDATYTENLELLPRVTYPWTINISVDGWTVKPVTLDEVLGR
jgi:hypothetical protein